jgi:hypothetical protein
MRRCVSYLRLILNPRRTDDRSPLAVAACNVLLYCTYIVLAQFKSWTCGRCMSVVRGPHRRPAGWPTPIAWPPGPATTSLPGKPEPFSSFHWLLPHVRTAAGRNAARRRAEARGDRPGRRRARARGYVSAVGGRAGTEGGGRLRFGIAAPGFPFAQHHRSSSLATYAPLHWPPARRGARSSCLRVIHHFGLLLPTANHAHALNHTQKQLPSSKDGLGAVQFPNILQKNFRHNESYGTCIEH